MKLPSKLIKHRKSDAKQNERLRMLQTPPKWLLTGEELNEKIRVLNNKLNIISKECETLKFKDEFPLIIKAKISDDTLAKGYRSKIQSSIKKSDIEIIGFSKDQEILVKLEEGRSEEKLNNLKKQFEETEKSDYSVSAITDISLSIPEVSLKETSVEKVKLKVKLYHFFNKYENKYVQDKVKKILYNESKNINIKEVKYSEELEVLSLEVDKEELNHINETLKGIPVVDSVSEMPKHYAKGDVNFFDFSPFETGKIDEEKINTLPIVGVLDSGIEKIEKIKPYIYKRVPYYPEEEMNRNHGTFVGSLIALGDCLSGKEVTGVNKCRILDACVYSKIAKTDEEFLILNIRDAIENNPEIKVWNLSISSAIECQTDGISDFAVFLDSIQKEHQVIIIKSAGNCENNANSRIMEGAESIRALTVGSVSSSDKIISPFSKCGPGVGYTIKPEIVHEGERVKSYNANGKIIEDSGTSFSTPRIAGLAAHIYDTLNPEEVSPLLVKSLIVHSANYPSGARDDEEKNKKYGFGIPKTFDEIMYNSNSDITLIMNGTLDKGNYLQISEFPFPKTLVDENNFFRGIVKITCCIDPLTLPNEGKEYCQTDLSFKFGTYNGKIKSEAGQAIINNNQNLLAKSLYTESKKRRKKSSMFEKELLKENKYHPIKQDIIDLEMMKDSNRNNYLSMDREWYLEMKLQFRDALLKQKKRGLKVDYCIVISIEDPLKGGQVYHEVINELNQKNFISQDINVENIINVSY